MNENHPSTPQVVGIINFHGTTLWVVEQAGVEFVYAKCLSDLAGIDWRRAKKTIQDGDNAILYGTTWLEHPNFASQGGPRSPRVDGIYIRLDRARMYLARIQTSQVRAQGNVDAAEALLALQIEWAKVLHEYETNGFSRKDARLDSRRQEERNLAVLVKTRREVAAGEERAAITCMIRDKLTELGYPPEQAEEAQGDLGL